MSPPSKTKRRAKAPPASAAARPSDTDVQISTDTSCDEDPCANTLLLAVAQQNVEKVAEFIATGCDLHHTPLQGCTPLLLAVKLRNSEIAKLLVKAGASCCDADANGLTVLHHVAVNGLADVVDPLVTVGKAVLDGQNLAGCTPLYQAAQHGHLECCCALLDLGAKLESRTRSGATPLYIAADRGNLNLVTLLLDAGADATVATELHMTPLLVAAFNGHQEVVQLLLSRNVSIEQHGPCGGTALYVAAQEGRYGIAECLLRHGAKVDTRCDGELTPSLIAAMQGHSSLVRLLLHAQGDISVRSEKGSTLAIMAARHGQTDVLKVLVEFGGPKVLEGENSEGASALGAAKVGRHSETASYIKGVVAAQKQADLNKWEASLPGLLRDLDPPSKKKTKAKARQSGKKQGKLTSAKPGTAALPAEPEVGVEDVHETSTVIPDVDSTDDLLACVEECSTPSEEDLSESSPWVQVTRKGIAKPVIAIPPPESPSLLPQTQPMPMLSPIATLSSAGPVTPMSAQSAITHGTTSPFGLRTVVPAWPSTPESWPQLAEGLSSNCFWLPAAMSMDPMSEKTELTPYLVPSTLNAPSQWQSVLMLPWLPSNFSQTASQTGADGAE